MSNPELPTSKEEGEVTPAQIILNLIRTHMMYDDHEKQGTDILEVYLEDADKLLKISLASLKKDALIDLIYDLSMFLAENSELDEEDLLRTLNTSLGRKPDLYSDK